MSDSWNIFDVLKTNDSFDIVDDVFCRIVDREESLGLNNLNKFQRSISEIWHAHGILGNGGFRYYYECRINSESLIDAYVEVGLSELAEVIKDADSKVQHLNLDSDSFEDDLGKMIQQNSDLFFSNETLVYEMKPPLEEILEKYIRDNVEHFRDL